MEHLAVIRSPEELPRLIGDLERLIRYRGRDGGATPPRLVGIWCGPDPLARPAFQEDCRGLLCRFRRVRLVETVGLTGIWSLHAIAAPGDARAVIFELLSARAEEGVFVPVLPADCSEAEAAALLAELEEERGLRLGETLVQDAVGGRLRAAATLEPARRRGA